MPDCKSITLGLVIGVLLGYHICKTIHPSERYFFIPEANKKGVIEFKIIPLIPEEQIKELVTDSKGNFKVALKKRGVK